MSEAKSKADKLIHDNAVMIFSKTYCPHCAHSKEVLQAKQKEYEAKGTPFTLDIFELNEASDGDDIQDYLKVKTGARTVPRIFIAEESLGGRDDLDASMRPKAEKHLESYYLKNAVDYTAASNN